VGDGSEAGSKESLLLLPAVLGSAAILRFYGLTGRGFIYWDEGKFALEGIRLEHFLQALTGSHFALAGKAVGTAKPSHALLIGMAYLIFGVHDYSPLLLNAAASVAAVGVLYAIARRLFGPSTALLAALLLATSEYDVIYARSALSESDANLLFLLGVLAWSAVWSPGHGGPGYGNGGSKVPGHGGPGYGTREPGAGSTRREPRNEKCQPGAGRKWRELVPPRLWRGMAAFWIGRSGTKSSPYTRTGAGVLLGAAFTTNYRLLVYIACLFAVDLAFTVRQDDWRRSGTALLAWLPGLALAPLVWQVVGVLASSHGIVLFRSEVSYGPTSYLSEALYQLHQGRQSTLHFQPLVYLQWFVVRQGWVFSILLLASAVPALLERSPRRILAPALVAGPYVLYAIAPIPGPRNLDASIPFAALLTASGLTYAAGRLRSVPASAVVLAGPVLLAAGMGSALSWRLTPERSGFAAAASYVRAHDAGQALVNDEVMVFYLRGPGTSCGAVRLPKGFPQLAAAYRQGYNYAVLDKYHRHVEKYVRSHARVLARFPAAGSISLGENAIDSEEGGAPRESTTYVSIYSVRGVTAAAPGKAPVCNQDHLA
jgi:hypothetical protein